MSVDIIDQELVIHIFAPLDGPAAATAYQQVRQLWMACRRLGMTESIPGIAAPAIPPDPRPGLPSDVVAAAQGGPDGSRQVVLRGVHDVLDLSVALAQPRPEGISRPRDQVRSQRPMGWAEWGQLWSHASAPGADAALGEARLYLARVRAGGTGAVSATTALGRALDPLLPYREDRAREWWRRGTTTSAGYAVWDLSPADMDSVREIVVVAAADREHELSAWTWSDGTTDLPLFARYLMHAAKLRYEARLLDSWGNGPRDSDLGEMLAELNVALAPDAHYPGQADLLRSRLSRLGGQEDRLKSLEADLERMVRTVAIARDNLSGAAGPDAGDDESGLFAADQALARWLIQQLDDDLCYLRIDLAQTKRARERAAEELAQAAPAESARVSPAVPGAADAEMVTVPSSADQTGGGDVTKRKVFVVYGRDTDLTRRFFDLLRAVDLWPLEWEQLVSATGRATPALAEVVAGAPHLAQATLVLFSADDIVELHSDLYLAGDEPQERGRSAQARPNVLFELGLALMAYPDSTVIVEVGHMRPMSDLAGLNVIRFDGSTAAIKKVLHRLEIAGCAVDYSGTDWTDSGRFAGLSAFGRGPDTHRTGP
jgi:predicted nucleotide-binding protein